MTASRRRRIYDRPIELGDVTDLEGLCRTMIDRLQSRNGSRLRPDDYDGLVAHVVTATWAEVTRQLGPHPNGNTASLAASVAWCQAVEWYRRRYGRTGRKLPYVETGDLEDAVDRETADRPLAPVWGQALPYLELWPDERRLLVLAGELTADEVAEVTRAENAREVAAHRRMLRRRLRELGVA